MKLVEILQVADSAYPEGMILAHWNACVGRPHARSQGDTLALFVVREIHDTYDPNLSDVRQLHEAARVIDRAVQELKAVREALDGARLDKALAEWCAR